MAVSLFAVQRDPEVWDNPDVSFLKFYKGFGHTHSTSIRNLRSLRDFTIS